MNVDEFLNCGALFTLPNRRLLVGWGGRQWLDQPKKSDAPSFYFPDFFLENKNTWFQHNHWQEIDVDTLLKLFKNGSNKTSLTWKNGDQRFFLKTFHELQEKFASKELLKAVPFSFASSQTPMDAMTLNDSLRHLLSYTKNTSLHPYGFWDKTEGMLGATPELLCSLSGIKKRSLSTIALAGTFSKDFEPRHMLNNPKELHEHQIVIKGIKSSLSSFGQIKTGQLSILELPTLYHLMTPLEITLKVNVQIKDVISALHPTPALGAFPRQAGGLWLKSIQASMDRRRFGAPAGVCYQKYQLDHYWVAIRNVQWDSTGMLIGAGCGIVHTSNPESEWNEILLKINATKQMLGL